MSPADLIYLNDGPPLWRGLLAVAIAFIVAPLVAYGIRRWMRRRRSRAETSHVRGNTGWGPNNIAKTDRWIPPMGNDV